MGHEYPLEVNWNSTTATIFSFHAFCVLLLAGAIWCVARSSRRPPNKSAILLWALAMAGALIVTALITTFLDPQSQQTARPFLTAYKSLFCITGFVGMLVSHRCLKAANQTSSLGFVLSVIALGSASFVLLIPTCVYPIEAARRRECRHNLKLIGIALHNHHDSYGSIPRSANGKPAVSWRVHALPYLDYPEIYDSYDETSDWDSESNHEIAKTRIQELTCPSTEIVKDDQGRQFTHYAMITGTDTAGSSDWSGKLGEVYHGTSNTLAVVEAAGLNIVWTEPRDSEGSDGNLGINLTGPTPTESSALISAWHRGGGHALLADGSVRFLSHDIDRSVLKALTTVNGGESLPEQY